LNSEGRVANDTPMRRSRFPLSTVALAVAVSSPALAGDPIEVTYPAPWADRWNYPFNPTPGTRTTASTFGNEPGSALFDNRDGQMIVGYLTGGEIPTGLDPARYEIVSATLVLEFASDNTLAYDPTPDPWRSFLPASDPAWEPDPDAGEPIEIFGVGFRNGFTRENWVETSPFTVAGQSVLNPDVRNAYPLGWRDGAATDVSNSVRQGWDPIPFAIGTVAGLEPGDLIPVGTRMSFDLLSGAPETSDYLAESLSDGKLLLSVTSLARVVQQGAAFPAFYCRENPLVTGGFAEAARLSLSVRIVSDPRPEDLDGDGAVGASDLTILLGQWGAKGGPADLDGNGSVGAGDLAALLAAWG